MSHIAVIDIGKTNAKLALVDGETLTEIAVVTRPNRPLPGPPWPHTDLEGHWQFFLTHLAAFHAEHGIDAISVTTHGAAAVLLDDQGRLAAPMLDYEHPGPDATAQDYDRLRPRFAETGSPRLPQGLNLGAQLHWQLRTDPDLACRTAHVLTYPQYWGWRLTGELACDVTSLGCHTDLWNPWQGRYSSLVERLGLTGKLPEARRPTETLGPLRPEIAAATGLNRGTAVSVGIHDSNASLYPYVMSRRGSFSVVSTGTWVVAMGIGADAITLDPGRDILVNVSALGQAVPSARFMGGREYEVLRAGLNATPNDDDRQAVLTEAAPLLCGDLRWHDPSVPDGQKLIAIAYYLAIRTDACLRDVGARGPAIVEGPFARNPDYLAMLSALRPGGVEMAASATGTSTGAALLCRPNAAAATTTKVQPSAEVELLRNYAHHACFDFARITAPTP